MIDRDTFRRQYAERSRLPLSVLEEFRTAIPCNCGEDGCEGWQMVSLELLEDDEADA